MASHFYLYVKAGKYGKPETAGIEDILTGIRKTTKDDTDALERGISEFAEFLKPGTLNNLAIRPVFIDNCLYQTGKNILGSIAGALFTTCPSVF
jgi:hypothetical protein